MSWRENFGRRGFGGRESESECVVVIGRGGVSGIYRDIDDAGRSYRDGKVYWYVRCGLNGLYIVLASVL